MIFFQMMQLIYLKKVMIQEIFFFDKQENIIQNINFKYKLNLKDKIYFFVLKLISLTLQSLIKIYRIIKKV